MWHFGGSYRVVLMLGVVKSVLWSWVGGAVGESGEVGSDEEGSGIWITPRMTS